MNDEEKVEEQVKAAVEEATATPELAFSVELIGGQMRIGGTLGAPAWMMLGLVEAAKMFYLDKARQENLNSRRIARPGLVIPH